MTQEERFWDKIRKNQDNDCIEWIGAINITGYGHFWYNGKCERAHRVSWQIHHGDIPDGLFVLHSCDNTKCVNPEHLWLGNNQDNAIDMCNKGRHCDNSGENQGRSKLTREYVEVIRSIYSDGRITMKELAKDFGVSQGSISLIVNYKIWR